MIRRLQTWVSHGDTPVSRRLARRILMLENRVQQAGGDTELNWNMLFATYEALRALPRPENVS